MLRNRGDGQQRGRGSDASSLLVDLEQGGYSVTLLPGWHFEKVEDGTVTDPNVEATLLSSQRVYVPSRRIRRPGPSMRSVSGAARLWLNGKVNLDINVYEDPDDYYGGQGGNVTAVGVEGAGGGDYSSGYSAAGVGGSGGY